MVSLIPVVEFEPFAFKKAERELLGDSDEDCAQYWRDCLADSGIVDMEPIHPRSWWVTIDQLLDPVIIRKLLAAAPGSSPKTEYETSLSELMAGFVLNQGDESIYPGCCSDFSTLDSWEEAAQWRSTDWQMIWIGHPWTHVSAMDDRLAFLHPTEEDPPKTRELAMYVMRHELLNAIASARTQVAAFTDRVAEAMKNA